MDLKALREQRAKLIADARAIIDKAETQKRGLSPEEVESQRKMLDDEKALVQQIRNAEELEQEEAALRSSLPESQRTATPAEKKSETANRYSMALRSYLRNGFSQMTADEQRTLQSG